MLAVKPTTGQLSKTIRKNSLIKTQRVGTITGKLSLFDAGQNGYFFAGNKITKAFHLAAIFVTEWEVIEKVEYSFQAAGMQHLSAGRTDPFNKL